ncbi:hypothetical protein, partial [Nocardia brasiliensis]|uniref:hypothetical protein n=1 Tax=Nocardia brasiliensis TaxID=37326 RepID=UPI0024552C02
MRGWLFEPLDTRSPSTFPPAPDHPRRRPPPPPPLPPAAPHPPKYSFFLGPPPPPPPPPLSPSTWATSGTCHRVLIGTAFAPHAETACDTSRNSMSLRS